MNVAQPVPVICTGSPFEMGLAQGRRLRASRGQLLAALKQLEAFRLQQPRWLPYATYRWYAERRAANFTSSPMQRRHSGVWQRLCGISSASGLRTRTLLLFNALEAALASVSNCTAPLGGCSAMAVRGARSKSGEPIVAHNFDYLPLVQPFYILRESRPEHGYRSLEFTAMPLPGAVDGVNEAGLCIAYNYAFANDPPGEPAPPVSVLVSEALTHCSTVQEAIDWITGRPRWGSCMLMLADQGGDLASLELSNTRWAAIRPDPGEDVLHHANYFASPRMREVQIPDSAVYTNRSPAPLRGRRLHESSEHRQSRFTELLGQPGPLEPDDVARIMSDHGPQGEPSDNTLCVHGTYWYTTATLQLLPASRSMRVSFSTACQATYSEFEIGGRVSVASCPSSN
jgi:predicted choloylglycine hydrolase